VGIVSFEKAATCIYLTTSRNCVSLWLSRSRHLEVTISGLSTQIQMTQVHTTNKKVYVFNF